MLNKMIVWKNKNYIIDRISDLNNKLNQKVSDTLPFSLRRDKSTLNFYAKDEAEAKEVENVVKNYLIDKDKRRKENVLKELKEYNEALEEIMKKEICK